MNIMELQTGGGPARSCPSGGNEVGLSRQENKKPHNII